MMMARGEAEECLIILRAEQRERRSIFKRCLVMTGSSSGAISNDYDDDGQTMTNCLLLHV